MKSDDDDRGAAVQALLDELCVTLGFCLPPAEQRRLRDAPPADPDAFAEAASALAVFKVEPLDA